MELSKEIGWAPGMAHGLVGLGYRYLLCDRLEAAGQALHDAEAWFGHIDDGAGVDFVSTRLAQLGGSLVKMVGPSAHFGWFRTHVTLDEGKVHCEFESPMRR